MSALQAILDQTPKHLVLLNEKEAAPYLGQAVNTLQALRLRGGGCPFVKVGRNVRYRLSDIEAYLSARVVSSTSEADRLGGAA